jgi:EAL domain-containing protein (putative c-di-GMP-specific phosphodiesterase class I)
MSRSQELMSAGNATNGMTPARGVIGGSVKTRELWAALERDEVEVHLQSEVWLEDGRHFGFEAKARMRRADDLLEAARFVPGAEHTAVSLPLARRLVEGACRELEGRDRSRPDALVSVAPSGLGEPDIYDAVTGALAATGSAPGRLCLEVSADAAIDQLEAAGEAWRALRELGVRFAINGCGGAAGGAGEPGALPLGPMVSFPFDYVRVDRSLVRAVSRSAKARRMVATIARTATEFDSIPVADGIETNAEAIAAFELGCKIAQGPRFGLPLPPRYPAGRVAATRS